MTAPRRLSGVRVWVDGSVSHPAGDGHRDGSQRRELWTFLFVSLAHWFRVYRAMCLGVWLLAHGFSYRKLERRMQPV